MSTIWTLLISYAVGVASSVPVSWYFFRKSRRTRLVVFVQFVTSVFQGIDSSVRAQLGVAFRGKTVDDMTQVQFVVVNEGELPIRDPIKPLSLSIPSKASLLDASVAFVHPEGREVSVSRVSEPDERSTIQFIFPLLNKGEGFIVRLLLSGELKPKELRFSISAEDLPPLIPATGWGVSPYGITPRATLGAWIIPAILLGIGGSIVSTVIYFAQHHTGWWPLPWHTFRPDWATIAQIVGAGLGGLAIVLLGMASATAQDGRPFWNPRPRFTVPRQFQPPRWIERDTFGRIPESHATVDE